MARLLALEWDAREARVVVARTRGKDLTVESAFTVELQARDPGQTFADPNVGQRIAAGMAARNIARGETLVAVGRSSIELRQMTLPPCPPEELPELVRFQAMQQFTTIREEWPLDFVELKRKASDACEVLAAAMSTEMVAQIRETCQAADLSPKRLILRPFAAASLLRRQDPDKQQPVRLMVDLLVDEADLTVMVDQAVSLMRTVRVPATDDVHVRSRALLGEIRRTIGSAQNQLGGQKVEVLVLCGDGTEQASLKALAEQELALDVQLFDPFDGVGLSRELEELHPQNPGRFTPLLGLLLDEASGEPHAIDFLSPRQKAEPPNQRVRNALIGATAAVAALAIVLLVWIRLATLDEKIVEFTAESAAMKNSIAKANELVADANAVESFLQDDYVWLDELYKLSETLPSSEDAIITQLVMGNRSPAGGQITVDGFTSEWDQIARVQEALRQNERRVVSKGGGEDPLRDKYMWQFRETVLLDPLTDLDPNTDEDDSKSESGGTDEPDATSPDEQQTADAGIQKESQVR